VASNGTRRCGPFSTFGIDSKLRACDLVRLKVRDICHRVAESPYVLL
jgi:hypothetical protein